MAPASPAAGEFEHDVDGCLLHLGPSVNPRKVARYLDALHGPDWKTTYRWWGSGEPSEVVVIPTNIPHHLAGLLRLGTIVGPIAPTIAPPKLDPDDATD